MIRLAVQMLVLFIAFILANMGFDWLDPEIAQGLNPWIAFPLSAFLALFVLYTAIMDIRHEFYLKRVALAYRHESNLRQLRARW